MNISFIGFGRMAQAMAQKLCLVREYTLQAASPTLTQGINAQGIKTDPNNQRVLSNADILILAVKPAQMNAVLEEIHALLPEKTIVISLAAGLNLSWLNKRCPNYPIVRAMPNIAAALGQSATPLIANQNLSENQKKQVEQMFNHLGITTWVNQENLMNAFTALSGSGPAYVFLFMHSMIKAAISLGIAEDIARLFTLQTVQGALCLASENKNTLEELIQQVTSPAGTTNAALTVFKNHDFETMIYQAISAATTRAKELSLNIGE